MRPSRDVNLRSGKINDALEYIYLKSVVGVTRRGPAPDWQVYRGCHSTQPKRGVGVGVSMVMGMVKHGMGTSTASTALIGGEREQSDDGSSGCWRGHICVAVEGVLGAGRWRMAYNIRGGGDGACGRKKSSPKIAISCWSTHATSIVYVHSRTLFSANKLGPEMLGNSSSDGK